MHFLSLLRWNIYIFGQEMFGWAPTHDIDVKTFGGKWHQNWRHNVKKSPSHHAGESSYTPWYKMDRVKRIWYLLPMRAAKVQASLRIRAVSPEPSLLAHTSNESRRTFRQKARPLAPLNGWACAVKICHDGMLEDTNSLDGAQMILQATLVNSTMHNSILSHTSKWQSGPNFFPYIFIAIRLCLTRITANVKLLITRYEFSAPTCAF